MPSGDGVRSGPSSGSNRHHQPARLFGIVDQNPDHLVDRHMVVVGVPAIVIGHHCHNAVGQFRLAGELRLGIAVMPMTSHPQER